MFIMKANAKENLGELSVRKRKREKNLRISFVIVSVQMIRLEVVTEPNWKEVLFCHKVGQDGALYPMVAH